MITEVVMPKYGWDTSVAKIAKWLKKEGDRIVKGEPIFILETEKATGEVPSVGSGILRKTLFPDGAIVNVGQLVGIIADPDDDIKNYINQVESISIMEKHEKEKLIELPEYVKIKASPAAKRVAKEHGIVLDNVKGTGPDGRITKEDVLNAIDFQQKTYEVIPIEGIRKTISERMLRSVLTTARVTQFIHVNLSKITELRKEYLPVYEKEYNIRLTYSHLFAKAVALALKDHPKINSILVGDEIRLMKFINLGIAVATDKGLIVVQVKNSGNKTLVQIASKMNELIEKARYGMLLPEEMEETTFTISNAGVFGIDFSTPLINTPETAIIGIGTIAERPIIVDGNVVARPTVYLSFSYDHRAIDGAPAAMFLHKVKQIIEEEPSILFKNIE